MNKVRLCIGQRDLLLLSLSRIINVNKVSDQATRTCSNGIAEQSPDHRPHSFSSTHSFSLYPSFELGRRIKSHSHYSYPLFFTTSAIPSIPNDSSRISRKRSSSLLFERRLGFTLSRKRKGQRRRRRGRLETLGESFSFLA